MLSNVKSLIGDLDKVKHVVKVFGMVQASPEFNEYARVVNGCSDLLVELYGENGRHARSSMGVTRNPFDGAVSIDAIFEVRE
jgi:enamine deaminase RidA (YjgF/YER057c/UK114 family)